uniref:Probable sesquiterpene synthase n=1 Tax=Santalum murrayanum TaxID=453085 RepID=SMST_SANMU|nr:RecName: Full=Probable sesquiterpene synthase; Short=SmSTPS [Santalum murrayanum]AEF32537.1 putative sesquiterpene synthase [Santalum murrayanum]
MENQKMPISSVPNLKDLNMISRPIANFPPSIWGDRFINYTCEDENDQTQKERQVEELKEQVRRELAATVDKPLQQLNIIDATQRLGIAYLFENEIEESLKHIYLHTYVENNCFEGSDDLYSVALWFRLLRQNGYKVSCDVFNKFRDNEGNFKNNLMEDAKGLLELYEATHVSIHGEEMLDDALEFTKTRLESVVSHLNYPLAEQVRHALYQPLHRGLPRLEAVYFFRIYEAHASHNKALLKLAKLDFNLLQSFHKKELSDIARWWKSLDFAAKFPFARDRLVEGYFWVLGVYFEPQYSLARKIIIKVFTMISTIDDIYDAYGTLDELKLFTKAMQRWDVGSLDQLPEYMKPCYKSILDVYNEIEEEMANQGSLFRMHYAKEVMKTIVEGYMDEAKWCHEKYVPTFQEYMSVALVTSGYTFLTTISYLGMGEIASKEAFDWLFSHPPVIEASESVGRLMDDMRSHKFEQERGHVASGIECYMKQYGVTEEEAHDEFRKRLVKAWKDINEECLRPYRVPKPLLTRILNLTRVIDVIYKNEDGYTHVKKAMKDNIASLLIDPVIV